MKRARWIVLWVALGAALQLIFDEYMFPRHPEAYCPNFFGPPGWCSHGGDL